MDHDFAHLNGPSLFTGKINLPWDVQSIIVYMYCVFIFFRLTSIDFSKRKTLIIIIE